MKSPDYKLIECTPDQRMLLYLIECYSGQFLTFIPRSNPDLSSHGFDHTLNIISNLNNFIINWNIELNQDEALLLYLAAWTHDIGCINGREKHHEISASLLLSNVNVVESLTERYAICLKYIILSHRYKKYNIADVPFQYENIRLRMICAIFRLMDACEICYPRCPRAVYDVIKDTLDDEATKFWIGHMNILGLKFSNPGIRISVNEREKCQFIIDSVCEEIDSIAETFNLLKIPVPTVTII